LEGIIVDKETLGSRIREQRKERNMTLEKFATAVGVSTQFFGDIERGAKMPSVNTLIKIVNNMDISCDYLLRDEVVAAKPYVLDEISEKMKDLSPQHLKIIKDVIFVMADNFMAIEKLNTELEE